MVEISGGSTGVVHAFSNCHTLWEFLAAFAAFDETTRISVIVLALLAVGGFFDLMRAIWNLIFRPRAPGPKVRRARPSS
jgi:hypothetical protein